MRVCPACKIPKELDEFGIDKSRKDGSYSYCRECTRERGRQWRKDNPEKMKSREMKRRAKNLEIAKHREKKKLGRPKMIVIPVGKVCSKCGISKPLTDFSKERLCIGGRGNVCKACDTATHKVWCEQNREHLRVWTNEYRRHHPIRQGHSLKDRLHANVSRAVRASLHGTKANRRLEDLLGYTVRQLMVHLEKRFASGMSWENYGTAWHIDHKVPLAVFNFERPEDIDFRICWSLKNLQPLEATKNIAKGATLSEPFQPSLALSERSRKYEINSS
jgi:hypothetical protein